THLATVDFCATHSEAFSRRFPSQGLLSMLSDISCNVGHIRSDRAENEPFRRLPSRRPLAMRPVPTRTQWCSGFFRPRLEALEDRVYPGDTLLGIWALGLWGSRLASQDGASASSRAQNDGEWLHGNSNLDSAD